MLAVGRPRDRPGRAGHRHVRFVAARQRLCTAVLPAGSRHKQDDGARGHDRLAPTYPMVLEELPPSAWHRTDRRANNRIEADHGRLKARLRPMRGLKQDRSARVIIAGHAFVQSLRRGHDELAVEEPTVRRLAVAFDELALAI